MMDREKLLAELDGSDETISRRLESGDFEAGVFALQIRNQQLREALGRIEELEAVVVPLEGLLQSGVTVCADLDDGEYCVEPYRDTHEADGTDYRGSTLAEALAAAVDAMEDAT